MKKICVTITTRGNYGKLKSVMDAINADKDLELQVLVGGEAILPIYGDITSQVDSSWGNVYYILQGQNEITMAKSAGLALIEYSSAFNDLKPDIVVVVGDRYDTLAVVMAATYLNIPVAHVEGGEVTGSIDESIRHAVTKLCHIHFPATTDAAQRIILMGENPDNVHIVGATSLDICKHLDLLETRPLFDEMERIGVGGKIDFNQDYIVVLFHPVTTEYEECYNQARELANAVLRTGFQALWISSHSDAGGDGVSKAIREFRSTIAQTYPIRFIKGLQIELYLPLITNAICLVGNSSSGIREAGFVGVPVVNIGTRQTGRMRGQNVLDVECKERDIADGIYSQFEHGHYPSDFTYGAGDSGSQIVEILKNTEIDVQKRNYY